MLVSGVRRLREELREIAAADLALSLTLVALLLQPVGDWVVRPLLLLLVGAALVLRGLRRSPFLWWGLFALAASRVLIAWPMSDNHAYLLAWWCLACALCLPIREGERVLATSARLLIGLTFLLAVLWKAVLSPDFTDQTFFRITLLLDVRFEGLAELGGGLTGEEIEGLRERLDSHVDGPFQGDPPAEALPARFLALATFSTVWTLASELWVSVAFLWPVSGGMARFRDAALLLFCATSYAFATVEGFGWLLLAMGVAQCDPLRERTRWIYLAVFVLILLYREVPWVDLLRPALGA